MRRLSLLIHALRNPVGDYDLPPVSARQIARQAARAAQGDAAFLTLIEGIVLMPSLNQLDPSWPVWHGAAIEQVRRTVPTLPGHVRAGIAHAQATGAPLTTALTITAPLAWQRTAIMPLVTAHLAAVLSSALGVCVEVDRDVTRWRAAADQNEWGWDATLWDGDWNEGQVAA